MDNNMQVLIVEDRPDFQNIYKKIVGGLGYQYCIASSVQESRELMRQSVFHVALIDLSLNDNNHNDRSGFEVLDLIKSANKDTQCFILTSYGKTTDVDKALKKKYDLLGFIDKSEMDIVDLSERIKEVAERLNPRMANGKLQSPKILIVEDSLEWKNILSKILNPQGYDLDTAGTYNEALAKLSTNKYALAIVDIRLDLESKDRRGLEVFSRIRQISPATATILCSAFDQLDQDISNAIVKYGAAHYFSKENFDVNYFLETVAKIIQPQLYATVDLIEKGPLKLEEKCQIKIMFQKLKPSREDFIRLPISINENQPIQITSTLFPSEGLDVFSPRKEIIIREASPTELFFDLVVKAKGLQELAIEFEYQYRPVASHRLLIEVE